MTASPGNPSDAAGSTRARHLSWAPAAIVLASLALRLAGIDEQSLWYDEGTSAALASRALDDILAGAANDIHPPLYYLLLAAWTRLAGASVFSMRLPSAAFGTILVALVYALGGRLFDRRAAATAAAFAAVSPLLVWYAQEVRMYALGAALSAALLWPALDLAEGRRPVRAWLLVVALATALLYTHYLVGAGAVAAASAAAGVWLAHSRDREAAPKRIAAWFVALALAVVALSPWLPRAWPAIRDWPSVGPILSPTAMLSAAGRAYALGPRVPPGAATFSVLVVALAVLTAATAVHRTNRRAVLATVAHTLTPVAILVLMAVSRSAWDPKQLVAGAPTFEVLVGACVAALWGSRAAWLTPRRLAAVVLLGAALAPRAATLLAVRTDDAYQRDDYEAIAAQIERLAGPSDAVVLNAPTQIEVFEYYDRGRHPTYPLPLGRRPPAADTRERLEEIGQRHRDLYAVLWAVDEADPERVVEGWLDAHRYKAFDRWFGNVRLAMWAAPREPLTASAQPGPDPAWHLPLAFGADEVVLLSLAQPRRELEPGDVLTLDASWTGGTGAPPRSDYAVFAHLVAQDGGIAAQRDMAPVGGTARTSTWSPPGDGGIGVETRGGVTTDVAVDGDVHLDRIGLLLPPDVPPGSYRVLLGLYDPATGRRLEVRPFVAEPGTSPAPSDTVVLGPYWIGPDAR